jgi:hypothetical protein
MVDFARLREARLQLHYGAQWLARAARAYVPAQPNDGHTNLEWDGAFGGLVTHALRNGERVGLQFTDLSLAVMDPYGARPARRFALNGRTEKEVRAWIGSDLRGTGLDEAALDAPSPYEMPSHAIARGARYLTRGLSDAFAELATWYGNADGVLGAIRQQLDARGFPAPPVRCWPHHFDLDTLVAFGTGEGARSTGAGFSPGDHYYDEPYFYVSLYPGPDIATLPRLPPAAHWHNEDFTAAIAPARKIVALKDQRGAVEAALRAAVESAIKALA